jgi:assimilatory nitrate reductase catalytic subunit
LSDIEYEHLAPVRWPVARGGGRGGGRGGERALEQSSARGVPRLEPLADGKFFTPSRRARFIATVPVPPVASADAAYPFVMLTGRIRDQWHTMTRTGKSPKLSQTKAEPFVEINSNDAIAAGLANGSIARIRSPRGEMLARVEWSDELARGEVFVPMHWTAELAVLGRVGALIDPAVDPHSGQAELKHTPVAIEPLALAWHGFILSREALVLAPTRYAVCARGAGFWRYELAGDTIPASWAADARARLGAAGDWVEYADRQAGYYRGARLVAGRLAACFFVSPKTRLPDRAWLGQLFAQDALDETDRMRLLVGRPADGLAVAGPVVCACYAVGRDALIRAIASQEATTVQVIGKLLKAGTNCGSCIPELNGLIAKHAPASAPPATKTPSAESVALDG